jgi:DNA topoisomerase VI subunit B
VKGVAQSGRVAFTTSRALEFFTESELTTQIGYRKELWPLVLIKELIDNAIDACETSTTKAIEIGVELDKDWVAVSDNGPGIAHKIIKGVLDYNVRISDKKNYVGPTRGQLGNALKCVVAAPFVATGKKSVIEIVARGRRHTIQVELDRIAQQPKISLETTEAPLSTGTILRIYWRQVASYFSNIYSDLFQYDSLDDAVQALIEDYAALNPHVAFTFNKVRRAASDPAWSKWRTDAPTSAHWYSADDLRTLIAAHICERDLPLRDFVGGFEGLARSRVRADVLEAAKLKKSHLSDLVSGKDVNMPSVTRLLEAMQNHSRPVQPKRLGLIGKDHLCQHFKSLGATAGFKYDRKAFYDDGGLPVVVETAFAIRPDAAALSRRIIGLNWSPIFKIPSGAIGEAITSCQVNSSDPVVLLVHMARPRFEFTDHGKGALA